VRSVLSDVQGNHPAIDVSDPISLAARFGLGLKRGTNLDIQVIEQDGWINFEKEVCFL